MNHTYQVVNANLKKGAMEYLKKEGIFLNKESSISCIDGYKNLEIRGLLGNNIVNVVLDGVTVPIPLEFLEIFTPIKLNKRSLNNNQTCFSVKIISDGMFFESINPIFIKIESDDVDDLVSFIKFFNNNFKKVSYTSPKDELCPNNVSSDAIMSLFILREKLQSKEHGEDNHLMTIEKVSYFNKNNEEYDVDNFKQLLNA
jgi:hypothetical protein